MLLQPAKPVPEWKEFTAPDGRKYYYNKATNESKWTNPEGAKGSAAPAAAQAAPSSVQVLCPAAWPLSLHAAVRMLCVRVCECVWAHLAPWSKCATQLTS